MSKLPQLAAAQRAPRDVRRIVAMGGGGFSMEPDNPLLDRFVLQLAGDAAKRAGRTAGRPRICCLPTASGDAEGYISSFHDAFDPIAEASDLTLFKRTVSESPGSSGSRTRSTSAAGTRRTCSRSGGSTAWTTRFERPGTAGP